MSYKLAVGQKVHVPVKFTLPVNGKPQTFKLVLICDRVSAEEWQKRIKDDEDVFKNELVRQLLIELTTDWEGQNFVLDEDTGSPAQFCAEAFEVLLDVPGVLAVITAAYMKESQATAKN